jgi:hypothetical protein
MPDRNPFIAMLARFTARRANYVVLLVPVAAGFVAVSRFEAASLIVAVGLALVLVTLFWFLAKLAVAMRRSFDTE